MEDRPQVVEETILGAPLWSARWGRLEVRFAGRTEGPLDELAKALPDGPAELCWLRQVHSARVLSATAGCPGEGDALTTDRPGLGIAIATADCVPVVIGGDDAVAVVHAGWRGIAAGIVPRAVEALAGLSTARQAWIGPAIGACCYEVGPDVAAAVVEASGPEALPPTGAGERPHLDLASAVAAQLASCGLERPERLDRCTRCDGSLHSYRRDGRAAGRNWTLAWLGAPG